MKNLADLDFVNSYAGLPAPFHARVQPQQPAGAHLASFSRQAADLLDLDPAVFRDSFANRVLSGGALVDGMDPCAMLYAGHQFGHYVPQLGDGRAILLGEVATPGGNWELQIKGAGQTPFSRDGDGRAVLRSTVREYLCSEAMHALGIPTTRALCMHASDEEVYRERIERGATLVRMAPGHVRFGSFEVFFYRGRHAELQTLADHVVARHYPELAAAPVPALALLHSVVERTADLVAAWQRVGFAHGVLNTDNMSILGLTLDYGPFGFMEDYDPGLVCNHSDHHGRYAFDRQPSIGLWNLSCLAQALLPLIDAGDGEAAAEQARAALDAYAPRLQAQYMDGMRAKLGLRDAASTDDELLGHLLACMADRAVDYSSLFRALADTGGAPGPGAAAARALFTDPAAFDAWATDYRARLQAEGDDAAARAARMKSVNPRYILRNYLAQQVIEQAEQGDYGALDRLLGVLSRPFDDQPEMAAYAAPAPDWGRDLVVSCSS